MGQQERLYMAIGFGLLALGVILGAFGAHALQERLSDHYLGVWETANKYHFIHALGIIIVLGIFRQDLAEKQRKRFFVLMCLGLLLFSGSLYLLSLSEMMNLPALKKLGAVAPIGGLLFIASWLYAGYAIWRRKLS